MEFFWLAEKFALIFIISSTIWQYTISNRILSLKHMFRKCTIYSVLTTIYIKVKEKMWYCFLVSNLVLKRNLATFWSNQFNCRLVQVNTLSKYNFKSRLKFIVVVPCDAFYQQKIKTVIPMFALNISAIVPFIIPHLQLLDREVSPHCHHCRMDDNHSIVFCQNIYYVMVLF